MPFKVASAAVTASMPLKIGLGALATAPFLAWIIAAYKNPDYVLQKTTDLGTSSYNAGLGAATLTFNKLQDLGSWLTGNAVDLGEVKTRGVDKHFELSTYDGPNDMLDDTSTSEIVCSIESNPENLNYTPTHHLLLNLCIEKDEFPKHFSYIRKKRTTLTDWQIKYKKDSNIKERPGDFVNSSAQFKLNNLHIPQLDFQDFKIKKRTSERKNVASYHIRHKLKTPSAMIKHMINSI